MDGMQPVVIVVPCFNEAERLRPDLFLQSLDRHGSLEFHFVDDGSRDRTGIVLTEMSAARPDRIRVLSLEENLGKAEAVRRGVLEALGGGAQVIGYWDADLAAPLSNLDDLLPPLDDPRARVVIGSRVKLLGRNIERRPLRHYLGRIFATAASLVLDLGIYDTQCGAKLFRRTPDLEACFSRPFHSRWFFDVEILARLKDHSHADTRDPAPSGWIEVPLRAWGDISGSKVPLSAFARAPLELLGIALRRRGE